MGCEKGSMREKKEEKISSGERKGKKKRSEKKASL